MLNNFFVFLFSIYIFNSIDLRASDSQQSKLEVQRLKVENQKKCYSIFFLIQDMVLILTLPSVTKRNQSLMTTIVS